MKQDQSSASSPAQDVMSRLHKRDLSIFKTGAGPSQDRSAYSQDSNSSATRFSQDEGKDDSEVSIVNIKEESEEDGGAALKTKVEANQPEHFMVMDDGSQAEYEQEEYDESYYEGYDDSQGGMLLEYEGGKDNTLLNIWQFSQMWKTITIFDIFFVNFKLEVPTYYIICYCKIKTFNFFRNYFFSY